MPAKTTAAAIDKSRLFRDAWAGARGFALGLDLTEECARQFFPQALRAAWAKARVEAAAPAVLATGNLRFHPGAGRHRSWLARVTGRDAKFGLAREFLKGASVYDDGPHIEFEVALVENEVFQAHTKDFWVVRGGALVEVSRWNDAAVAELTARFA